MTGFYLFTTIWKIGVKKVKAVYMERGGGEGGDEHTSIACRTVSASSSPFSLQSRNLILTAAIFAAFSTELWALGGGIKILKHVKICRDMTT